MASMFPAFRTRSPTRDKETDERRRTAICLSIEQTLDDAKREMLGLERRIADARLRTVLLMDNSGDYSERAAADEHDIVSFEREADQASLRLEALRQQVVIYSRLLAIAGAEL